MTKCYINVASTPANATTDGSQIALYQIEDGTLTTIKSNMDLLGEDTALDTTTGTLFAADDLPSVDVRLAKSLPKQIQTTVTKLLLL